MQIFLASILILLSAVAAEAGWVADLTWTPSAGAKLGTRVERKVGAAPAFSVVAPSLTPGVSTFTDPGPLTDGVAVTYRVVEFNAAGDAANSPQGTVTPLSVPAGATGLGIQLRFQ